MNHREEQRQHPLEAKECSKFSQRKGGSDKQGLHIVARRLHVVKVH